MLCDGSRTGGRKPGAARHGDGLIPHSSFCEEVLPRRSVHGGANESESGKCSGSWHPARLSPGDLFPAFTPGTSGDWLMGNRIQLQQRNCFRFSRNSFHRFANGELAKNCR